MPFSFVISVTVVSVDVSEVVVDSVDAPVSVEVAVPDDVSPSRLEVKTIFVFDRSLSTIPANVSDVELPFASGAK